MIMKTKPEPSDEESAETNPSSSDAEEESSTSEDHPGDLSKFALSDAMVEKLAARGVQRLFPVQYLTFHEISNGLNVVAQAHTGTGKTFAFAIPLVEKLQKSKKALKLKAGRKPSVLVLAPTRELAKQIATDFSAIISTNLTVLSVYGGVPYEKHTAPLKKGVDIVVGAPGRVKDLMEQGHLSLNRIRHVILDEVDRMLDMGFRDDVDTILRSLYERGAEADAKKMPQTLMFSATLPSWVKDISRVYLSAGKKGDDHIHRVCLTGDTVNENESSGNKTSSTVEHLALQCPWQERPTAISDVIRAYCVGTESRCIVFCERKKDADELAAHAAMSSECHVLHGDIPQEKRELVLEKFRSGKYRILVTTNVAARGLDIPSVDLVIQCRPPKEVDDYIHRSGRTGRAGRAGQCVCFYTMKEREELQMLEKAAGIVFRRINCPTAGDIVKSSISTTIEAMEIIPEATWQVFLDAARTIIEELGAERAVACSLAKMHGKIEELKPRSLLTTREGFTAYHLATNNDNIRGKGYAYVLMRKYLPEQVSESISHLMFTKDKLGFVFDVPSEHAELIKSQWQDENDITLLPLTELPELADEEKYIGTGGGSFMNNGRGGSFRGGRGGFDGNRGRGRGRGDGSFRGGSFQRPWQNRNGMNNQQDEENTDGENSFRGRGRGGRGGGRGFRGGQWNGSNDFSQDRGRGSFRGKRQSFGDDSSPDTKKPRLTNEEDA